MIEKANYLLTQSAIVAYVLLRQFGAAGAAACSRLNAPGRAILVPLDLHII